MFKKILRYNYTFRNSYLHTPGDNIHNHVTLLPGVGIGPEITSSVLKIFKAANVPLEFDILKNFDFTDESHKKLMKMNKYLLLGNTGGLKSPSLEHL